MNKIADERQGRGLPRAELLPLHLRPLGKRRAWTAARSRRCARRSRAARSAISCAPRRPASAFQGSCFRVNPWQDAVIDVSRRQVLVGLGGATLALPVLPSLLTRTAYGADPVLTTRAAPVLAHDRSRRRRSRAACSRPSRPAHRQRGAVLAITPIAHGALTRDRGRRSDALVSPILRASRRTASARRCSRR